MAEKIEISVDMEMKKALAEFRRLDRNVSSLEKDMGKFSGKTSQQFKGMGLAAGAMGGAVVAGAMAGVAALQRLLGMATRTAVAIGKTAVRGAISFEQAMAKSRTMARLNDKDWGAFREELLELTKAWGLDKIDAATASYDVFSGVTKDATGALQFLDTSMELAVVGFDALARSNKTLVTTMNALRWPMDRSREAAIKLWATVDSGVLELLDLNAATGRLSGSLGTLPFEEVLASLGFLTKALGNPAEAVTALRGLIDQLTKTEGASVEMAKKHGLVLGPVALQQRGLVETERALVEIGEKDLNVLRGIIRETMAWNAINAIMNKGLPVIESNVEGIRDSLVEYEEALKIATSTTQKQLDVVSSEWDVLLTKVGDEVLVPLKNILATELMPVLEDWGEWVRRNKEEIAGFFWSVHDAILAARDVLKTILGMGKPLARIAGLALEIARRTRAPEILFPLPTAAAHALVGRPFAQRLVAERFQRLIRGGLGAVGGPAEGEGGGGGAGPSAVFLGTNYFETPDPRRQKLEPDKFRRTVTER